jgi:hypothetical protein
VEWLRGWADSRELARANVGGCQRWGGSSGSHKTHTAPHTRRRCSLWSIMFFGLCPSAATLAERLCDELFTKI